MTDIKNDRKAVSHIHSLCGKAFSCCFRTFAVSVSSFIPWVGNAENKKTQCQQAVSVFRNETLVLRSWWIMEMDNGVTEQASGLLEPSP